MARARVPPPVHRLQQRAIRGHEDEADDEEEGEDEEMVSADEGDEEMEEMSGTD